MKDAGRARDVLVERWRGDALRFARVVLGRTRATLAYDEMESEAMWGLLQAIDRFDPSKGARFSTYLYYKVRGAVLDHVRDACHRADRSRLRFHSLEQLEGRMSIGGDRQVLLDADIRAFLPLVGLSTASDSAALALLESDTEAGHKDRVERAEIVELAMRALRNHPRLRKVVEMYFYEGKTLQEVGTRMSFSEQRAMQLVHKALRLMRQDLDSRGISKEDVA